MTTLHQASRFAFFPWTLAYSALLVSSAAYLLGALLLRWRRLRQPEFVRIEPGELKAKLDSGDDVAVIDLRHALDRLASPFGIPGAIWLPPESLQSVPPELRRRLVVFYCTCPNSASMLHMARGLRQAGIRRMRPLCGGVEAWRRAGFPVEAISDLSASRSRAAAAK